MHASLPLLLSALPVLTSAIVIPLYSELTAVFHDDFWGFSGETLNTTTWEVIEGDLNVNNELETYTGSNKNLQISGGGTLQLVPWRNSSSSSGWTSARIQSVESYTPVDGKKTRVEASIRMGYSSSAGAQGIWPAFWMLGDSMRHGTSWPACGELDIMEQLNGVTTAYGTAHCADHCDEANGGLQSSVSFNTSHAFHTWRLDWDRTTGDWTTESITWYLDGVAFKSITGATIGDEATWGVLAHSPFYILLNVAVGGDWPGNPDDSTLDGYDSMMEVAYVAVYSSLL